MSRTIGSVGWRREQRQRTRPEEDRRELLDEREEDHWDLATRLTILVTALYAFTFALLSIHNHQSFQTHAFDLGNMDQAVWNTYQGRPFAFTNWEGGNTRLAAHVEPILLLVAQLYRIHSGPETLLVLQSVVLAVGALPAFWLAKQVLKNELGALAFAAAFLLSPALEAANLADFHPVALASSFLMFALYFLVVQRYRWFFVFAVLAMSTKEQIPLTIVLMGLYIVFIQKRPRPGWAAVILGALWFVIAFGVIIPQHNPTGASPYLSRYDHIGDSPVDLVFGLIRDPGRIITIISDPARQAYLRGLFGPVAYLPLLSPLVTAFAAPDLAINLLSNFEWMYSGEAHYGAAIVPILVGAGILGAARLVRWIGMLRPGRQATATSIISVIVLLSSVVSYWNSVFLPLRDNLPEITEHHRIADSVFATIPADAAVSTGSTINPHLSQREKLYLFPDLRDADYVVLDVTATPHPIDWPSQKWRIDNLIASGWGIHAALDGYLVLRRGATETKLPDEFFTFTRAEVPEELKIPPVLFGDALELVGWDWSPKGDIHGRFPKARLVTYWQVRRPVEESFDIQFEVVSNEGRIVETVLGTPTTVWYPTRQWQPGETIKVALDDLKVEGEGVVTVRVLRPGGDPNRREALRPLAASGVELRGDSLKLFDYRTVYRPPGA